MELYRARWVLPASAPPIERGWLAVEAGRIVAVGAADDAPPAEYGRSRAEDLGDHVLLPGFVNAHTHLELTGYRDRLPAGPLWPWIEALVALRRAPEAAETERVAVRFGAEESLAAGVTCLGDVSRSGSAAEALGDCPLRAVCFLELISGAGRAPSDAASLAAGFTELTAGARGDRLRIGLSPHAPYTVTEADLSRTAELARASGAPLAMHFLETTDEVRWLSDGTGPVAAFLRKNGLPNAEGFSPTDPIDLLQRCGVLDQSPLLIHVNYPSDARLDRLAAADVSIAWCPRAHRFFGHSPHPWRSMMARGIRVCIGTDSAASNDSLSILDELRAVRAIAPDFDPCRILQMGTLDGAKALKLDGLVGSLEAGKRADFVTVPMDVDGGTDPAVNLLDGRTTVDGVWIDGTRVV